MSNMGLALSVEPYGIKIATTKVGDRYVLEEMKTAATTWVGSSPGTFADRSIHDGDGMQSAIHLASLLMRSGKSQPVCKKSIFIRRSCAMPVAPQYKTEVYEKCCGGKEIRKMEAAYQGKGRLLIRPSGHRALGAHYDRRRKPGSNRSRCQSPGKDYGKELA